MSTEQPTAEYKALDFDGTERRANYRTVAYREDVLHVLDRKDAAAIVYEIIYWWQTSVRKREVIKEIERRRKSGAAPLTEEEAEDMMWAWISYNEFVRESGGAVGYNTVIRTLDYLVNIAKVVEQRENHDSRFADYEYRINKEVIKEKLKALPVSPAFAPKIPKKKSNKGSDSTQMGTPETDSTQTGIHASDSTQMGTGYTQEGRVTTQMGTVVYPNGGTSHNYSHNYTSENTQRECISPPTNCEANDSALAIAAPAHTDFRSQEIAHQVRRAIAQTTISLDEGVSEELISQVITRLGGSEPPLPSQEEPYMPNWAGQASPEIVEMSPVRLAHQGTFEQATNVLKRITGEHPSVSRDALGDEETVKMRAISVPSKERKERTPVLSTLTTSSPQSGAKLSIPARPGKTKKPALAPVPSGPLPMPAADAVWKTATCLMMFNHWRGKPLIGTYKNSQASTCAKGLAANYTREQVEVARNYMVNDDPYWSQDPERVDICQVANHIHEILPKMARNGKKAAKKSAKDDLYSPARIAAEQSAAWAKAHPEDEWED